MALDLDLVRRTNDTIPLRSGVVLSLRFAGAGAGDADLLRDYFRALSMPSRTNRLMSATRELPEHLLERFLSIGDEDAFTVIAMILGDRAERVVAELRYAHHADEAAIEFGLSVDDRWHGHGIGTALLGNLQCRAAALGAGLLYGDTLRTNVAMLALARSFGFTLVRPPHDWKQIRLEKPVAYVAQDVPCASWRLAAEAQSGVHRSAG